MWSKEIVGLYL